MTEIKSETAPLQWELLTKKRASSTLGLPPGKEHLAWVSNTVTLIYGRRDAVLVDTFLTADHAKDLLDWVISSGKNLVAIYITTPTATTTSALSCCWITSRTQKQSQPPRW
jgi:hypothetical protein